MSDPRWPVARPHAHIKHRRHWNSPSAAAWGPATHTQLAGPEGRGPQRGGRVPRRHLPQLGRGRAGVLQQIRHAQGRAQARRVRVLAHAPAFLPGGPALNTPPPSWCPMLKQSPPKHAALLAINQSPDAPCLLPCPCLNPLFCTSPPQHGVPQPLRQLQDPRAPAAGQPLPPLPLAVAVSRHPFLPPSKPPLKALQRLTSHFMRIAYVGACVCARLMCGELLMPYVCGYGRGPSPSSAAPAAPAPAAARGHGGAPAPGRGATAGEWCLGRCVSIRWCEAGEGACG